MGTFVFGGRLRAPPAPEGRVRRGRRRLGAALQYRMDHAYERHRNWMPHGDAVEDAERVLPREHLRHVPGRLGGVQGGAPHERRPAHVGQRLPAQRLHVAVVAGDARRAHRRTSPSTSSAASCTTTWPSSTASTARAAPHGRGASRWPTISIVIRGGTVVDGTGAAGIAGDVAIDDGRVVAIERATRSPPPSPGPRSTPTGRVVAPGFVDIHTHYDAQILWDRMLTVSPWHGVTTVVTGNCGFGVAPDPARRTATSSSARSRRSRA